MTKLMLAAVAALSICLGAKAETGDLLAHLSFDDYGNDGLNVLKATVGEDGIVRTTTANVVEGLGAVTPVTDTVILSGLREGDGAVSIPVNTHIALPIPAALASESGKPWSISMKVKFPSFGMYYSILNMPAANNSDTIVFLSNSQTPIICMKQVGNSRVDGSGGFVAGQWETLLFLFDSNRTRVLLNGKEIFNNSCTLAGSRADCANEGGYILISADNDGDDALMYWADVKVYDGIVDDNAGIVTHTVTWRNDDHSLLKREDVVEGCLPDYGVISPSKASGGGLVHFTGWTPALEPVFSNVTYTATYGTEWNVVNLAEQTADYTAHDGDMLTGNTAYGVSILAGATVILADANIVRSSGPAISCAGDATILLADGTANFATGNPGIRLPDDTSKTLTITVPDGGDGSGALTAAGNWGGAGIGNTYDMVDKGNLCIAGGNITATGGSGAAGIGDGNGSGYTHAKVGDITISGGTVIATGSYNCSAIGRTGSGRCGAITIGPGVQKIVASNSGSADVIASYSGSVTIASSLRQTYSNNNRTLTIEPDFKYDITWLTDDGAEINTTIVSSNAVPSHAEPSKAAEAPYRWVFTGWTPDLEPAVSNTTYTATFKKIADLSLVESDWTAADGDEIVGEATHEVTIPGGAHVTINGVAVAGAGGGGATPAPTFAADGKAATTEFVQGEGGKWTLTTFAELSNDALGADVAAEQIKVYAADTVEGLESASPMTKGVTVKEKKSAVKTTIEVTPSDSTAAQQFFKVKFGE